MKMPTAPSPQRHWRKPSPNLDPQLNMNANSSGAASLQQRLRDFRDRLNAHEANQQKRQLDPTLQRQLDPGWLLPALLKIDDLLWRRWDYWYRTQLAGRLLDETIPQIPLGTNNSLARCHWERCLDLVPNCGRGGWRGWGSWERVNYLLDWLLYGLGHSRQPQLSPEPPDCKGASMRLYQRFNLAIPLAYPYDYFGDILAENNFGRSSGFYPTPQPLATLMAQVTLTDEDCRTKSVLDPCLGTGRLLLEASNHSLCLYGQDINTTVLNACLINGYLYAPWLVKPFPFLSQNPTQHDLTIHKDGKTPTQTDVAADLETSQRDRKNNQQPQPPKRPLKPNLVQTNVLNLKPANAPSTLQPPKLNTPKLNAKIPHPQQPTLPTSSQD